MRRGAPPVATLPVDDLGPGTSRGTEFLLLPSFYGLVGWVGTLIIYLLSPYEQYFLAETWGVIFYTIFIFIASMLLFLLSARRSLERSQVRSNLPVDRAWFFVTALIGGYGLYIYIRDFSAYFGGYSNFLLTLTRSSLDVRAAAEIVGGLGFQISYVSWIAVFFGIILGTRVQLPTWQRIMFLTAASVMFVLNLAFVDRTRPIWILVVCLFGFVISRDPKEIRPARAIFGIAGVPLFIFFFFAVLSGKFDVRAGLLDNFVIYVTGGLGYLDTLVGEVVNSPFTVAQTFLPVSKLLKGIGVLDVAPPEILDFRFVPFATNVGTFLQPLFADGGWTLLLLGLPALVLGTDWLALACFRTRTLMGRFFWANLTFTMLISFFVPKYNNTAIYVFAAVLLLDQFGRGRSVRNEEAAAGPRGAEAA